MSAAVRAYLEQTEREKAERGLASPAAELPSHYRAEVADPAAAYSACRVLVAEAADASGSPSTAGVVVVGGDADEAEIKRLWADPAFRGRGVGSALLDAALASGPPRVRLTVWEWRDAALRLYESRGFRRVGSWDARLQLVCMRRGR